MKLLPWRRLFDEWNAQRPLLLVQLVVTATIVIAHACRVSSSNITLRVSATAAQLQLAGNKPWNWPGPWPGRLPSHGPLRLSQVSRIESGLFPTIEAKESDAWLTVDNAAVSLDDLFFERGGWLEIAVAEEGLVELGLQGAGGQGQLQLGQGSQPLVSAGTSAPEPSVAQTFGPLAVPEDITFRFGPNPVRALLHLAGPDGTTPFHDLRLVGLAFQQEAAQSSGERRFYSTIRGGSLHLTDLAREIVLEEGHELRLEGAEGRVGVLTVGKLVELSFVGKARRIRTGFAESMSDVTPTLLQWVYHNLNHHIILLALIPIWLAIWKLSQHKKKWTVGLLVSVAVIAAALFLVWTAAGQELP